MDIMTYALAKKLERANFWNEFQENGSRTDYMYAFYGKGWNFNNFNPIHNIAPQGNAKGMFYYFGTNYTDAPNKSLIEHCKELGITLDLTNATSVQQMFSGSASITEVPAIDYTKCTSETATAETFRSAAALRKIEKLIVNETNGFTNNFNLTTALEEITIEGTIGKSIDLHWSKKLNKASIESIIGALSTGVSGQTLTLSETAVDKAFETSTGKNDGSNSTEWTNLIAGLTNWSITLS